MAMKKINAVTHVMDAKGDGAKIVQREHSRCCRHRRDGQRGADEAQAESRQGQDRENREQHRIRRLHKNQCGHADRQCQEAQCFDRHSGSKEMFQLGTLNRKEQRRERHDAEAVGEKPAGGDGQDIGAGERRQQKRGTCSRHDRRAYAGQKQEPPKRAQVGQVGGARPILAQQKNGQRNFD